MQFSKVLRALTRRLRSVFQKKRDHAEQSAPIYDPYAFDVVGPQYEGEHNAKKI